MSDFIDIPWAGRTVRIEHAWVGVDDDRAPVVVFLHEGLGSVSMWRDWPERLCAALGLRGLVYSRPGYGRSTPRAAQERWAPDFMHRQAGEVLPALRQALGLTQPVWLFGHSDGGSIALLHAARAASVAGAEPVAGLIVLAPHTVVEDVSVRSIAATRQAYTEGDLRPRLARHHDDPDSAFFGWADIWLDPAFRSWNITGELPALADLPILAVQGLDDGYGTLEQVQQIARCCRQTELLVLPACGHSPHRQEPEALIAACQGFLWRTRQRRGPLTAGAG